MGVGMHTITIEPISMGQRGMRYRVSYAGEILLEGRDPELAACRALLARGITGRLEVWRPGTAFPSMRIDIARAAQLTAEEGFSVGPRFRRWTPTNWDAVSSCDIGAPAAVSELTG
jgi:hypothetical protein